MFDDDIVRPISERVLANTFGSIDDDPSTAAGAQTSYLLFYQAVEDEARAENGASDNTSAETGTSGQTV